MTTMSSGKENWAVDELLKAEEDANKIIKKAQKERLGFLYFNNVLGSRS